MGEKSYFEFKQKGCQKGKKSSFEFKSVFWKMKNKNRKIIKLTLKIPIEIGRNEAHFCPLEQVSTADKLYRGNCEQEEWIYI